MIEERVPDGQNGTPGGTGLEFGEYPGNWRRGTAGHSARCRTLQMFFAVRVISKEEVKTMRDQKRFLVSDFSIRSFVRFLTLGLVMCLSALAGPPRATAQVVPPGPINPGPQPLTPIPATAAFDAPACSAVQLRGVDILGHNVPSPYRGNPEWKAIILDSSQPPNLQPPTILEGFVSPQPKDQTSSSQSTAEVA